jgi:hypothetical protein
MHASHPRRALTVREGGALSDLDNIAVGIADVAADLAVLGYWFRDELGSSTFPQFIARTLCGLRSCDAVVIGFSFVLLVSETG